MPVRLPIAKTIRRSNARRSLHCLFRPNCPPIHPFTSNNVAKNCPERDRGWGRRRRRSHRNLWRRIRKERPNLMLLAERDPQARFDRPGTLYGKNEHKKAPAKTGAWCKTATGYFVVAGAGSDAAGAASTGAAGVGRISRSSTSKTSVDAGGIPWRPSSP